MTPITLQFIKKPEICGMILLFSRSPLVCTYPSISPGKNCAEVGDDPLRRVAAEDGDGVVAVQAEVDERPRHDLHVGEVLLVRPLLPLAVALHPQSRSLQSR